MTSTTFAHADAAARLRVVVARLVRQLRQQTLGELTLSQWSALVTVEAHAPLRIGELADREGVSAATATRLVASLEAGGLLAREPDAADRRSSRVSLTPAGRDKLEWARKVRTVRLAKKLSQLSPADVGLLLDALPVLETLAADE